MLYKLKIDHGLCYAHINDKTDKKKGPNDYQNKMIIKQNGAKMDGMVKGTKWLSGQMGSINHDNQMEELAIKAKWVKWMSGQRGPTRCAGKKGKMAMKAKKRMN